MTDFDSVDLNQGWCNFVAAVIKVMTTADIIMCLLTVHVLHAVYSFNPQKSYSADHSMSIAQTNVLPTMTHVTLKRCTGLNPSTFFPNTQDGEPHG